MTLRRRDPFRSLDRVTGLLLIATAALAVLAVVTSVQIQRNQDEIVQIVSYDLSSVYERNQVEILRLQATIGAVLLEAEPASAAALRWSILKGRISTIPASFGSILIPESIEARQALDETLDSIEPLVASLDIPGNGTEALSLLKPSVGAFTRIASLARIRQVALADQKRAQLAQTMVWLNGCLLLLCSLGVASLSLVFHQKRKLKYAAHTDGLTGLPNRAALNVWSPKRGFPSHLALAVIDVDRFKQVNDTLGHAAGDDLLRALGQVLRDQMGPDVFCARLGGDEFVVIVTGTDCREIAMARCASVRRGFRAVCEAGDHASVTLSIGIAAGLTQSHDDIEVLIARSDNAMYDTKRMGGNAHHLHAEPDGSAVAANDSEGTTVTQGLESERKAG